MTGKEMLQIEGNIHANTGNAYPGTEQFDTLLNGNGWKVERIITFGSIHEPGPWYDQDTGEWVLLIEGEASLEMEDHGIIRMKGGDYLFIPAHVKHRVVETSAHPNCLWLAIHGDMPRKG
ncbi:MAG: cupin domain-containing protein [Bacteroidales bacterium]|nr:cupin domain-containing protein [Bacteroidales bacterium]